MQVDKTTYKSPNYNNRPANTAIDAVTAHVTAGAFDSDMDWLCNPASGVSAHYGISPDGKIYQLVDPKFRAWHAGDSYYAGRDNWNNFSIGIEMSHEENTPRSQNQMN